MLIASSVTLLLSGVRTALHGLVALCSAGRLRRGYDSERFQLLVKQTRNDALAQALTAPSFSFSLAVEERTTRNPSSDIVQYYILFGWKQC
jgi:hypothetical protein